MPETLSRAFTTVLPNNHSKARNSPFLLTTTVSTTIILSIYTSVILVRVENRWDATRDSTSSRVLGHTMAIIECQCIDHVHSRMGLHPVKQGIPTINLDVDQNRMNQSYMMSMQACMLK